ncbi:hypothetical protein [Salinibacter altiplanensis]|nr:hypothetical protein [Salinibacter altiplanensis]
MKVPDVVWLSEDRWGQIPDDAEGERTQSALAPDVPESIEA